MRGVLRNMRQQRLQSQPAFILNQALPDSLTLRIEKIFNGLAQKRTRRTLGKRGAQRGCFWIKPHG